MIEFKQSLEYVDPQSPDLLKAPETYRRAKLVETQKAVLHSALKTIAAFLNSRGGTLLLGVHDNGTVVGIEPDYALCGDKPNQDGFELKLLALLKSRVTPLPVDFDVRYATLDGKTVAVVQVSPSATPHYLDTKLYIRLGNSTHELLGREIEDWLGRRTLPVAAAPAPDPELPYEGVVAHGLPWQALPPSAADTDPQLRKLKEMGYQFSLPTPTGVATKMGKGWQYVVWKSPDGAFFRLCIGFPVEDGNVWMMRKAS